MSNHDLKPTDYSNTVVRQNENSASVVSVFPLVGAEQEQVFQGTQSITTTPPPPPQTFSGGGSSY